MIRFVRDPQPPYTQFKQGMVRDLGSVLEAYFLGTLDAVAHTERDTMYPPSRELVAPGATRDDPVRSFNASEVASIKGVVSDARITTWANRAALVALGLTSAFFTDVGVGGSHWDYVGGRWRPSARRVTLKNLTADVSNNGAPKVVMDYATLLAGIWQDGDIIECKIVKERTGGTSDTDATDVMLGTVAATLGTSLNLSTSALATTTISMAALFAWRRVSNTSVRSQGVAGAVGLGTSTSANSLITGLANLDSTDTFLQVTSDLTTAGGEVSWLRGYTVTLISGA